MKLYEAATIGGLVVGLCGLIWITFAIWTVMRIESLRSSIDMLHSTMDGLETQKREEELRASFHNRLVHELKRGRREI